MYRQGRVRLPGFLVAGGSATLALHTSRNPQSSPLLADEFTEAMRAAVDASAEPWLNRGGKFP